MIKSKIPIFTTLYYVQLKVVPSTVNVLTLPKQLFYLLLYGLKFKSKILSLENLSLLRQGLGKPGHDSPFTGKQLFLSLPSLVREESSYSSDVCIWLLTLIKVEDETAISLNSSKDSINQLLSYTNSSRLGKKISSTELQAVVLIERWPYQLEQLDLSPSSENVEYFDFTLDRSLFFTHRINIVKQKSIETHKISPVTQYKLSMDCELSIYKLAGLPALSTPVYSN